MIALEEIAPTRQRSDADWDRCCQRILALNRAGILAISDRDHQRIMDMTDDEFAAEWPGVAG